MNTNNDMHKKDRIILRIRELMKLLDLNQSRFAEAIGVRQNNLSEMLSGKRPIGEAILFKICSRFEIDQKWMEEGVGVPFKKADDTASKSNARIVDQPKYMNVPLVNVRARCGYLEGYGDVEYMEALPTMPVIVDKEYRGRYMLFEAGGDSMDNNTRDSICDGDIVLGREIQRHLWSSKLHIRDWYFIIVHKTDGVSIKMITDHNVESGVITCHPLNDLYDDYTVNLSDVVEIYNLIKIVDRSARL